jgi:hypothetical protein
MANITLKMSVRLIDIWTASLDELLRVLPSSISLRELVAKFYLQKDMLEEYDANLM